MYVQSALSSEGASHGLPLLSTARWTLECYQQSLSYVRTQLPSQPDPYPSPAYSAVVALQVLFECRLQSIDHLFLQVLHILQGGCGGDTTYGGEG